MTFGSEYVRENISGTDLGVNGDGISELTENGITKNRSRKSFSTYMPAISKMKWNMGNGLLFLQFAMIITVFMAVMHLRN